MKTWKTNLEETKQRYINWWNHKGIILSMWEHFQEGVKPHADIAPPAPVRGLSQKWFDPQWRAEYLDWYVAHSSLMADMLPVANTSLLIAVRDNVNTSSRPANRISCSPTIVPPRTAWIPISSFVRFSRMTCRS